MCIKKAVESAVKSWIFVLPTKASLSLLTGGVEEGNQTGNDLYTSTGHWLQTLTLISCFDWRPSVQLHNTDNQCTTTYPVSSLCSVHLLVINIRFVTTTSGELFCHNLCDSRQSYYFYPDTLLFLLFLLVYSALKNPSLVQGSKQSVSESQLSEQTLSLNLLVSLHVIRTCCPLCFPEGKVVECRVNFHIGRKCMACCTQEKP